MIENSHHPLVSVIMPCYRMGRFIGEALESVGKQTYTNWEVLAVDDAGPEDGTKEAVKGFAKQFPNHRVIYHRHEKNGGVSAARNTAIGLARGKIVALLDADDTWKQEHLQVHINVYLDNPKVVLSYSQVITIDEDSQIITKPTGFYNLLGVMGRGIRGNFYGGFESAMMDSLYVPVSAACLSRDVVLGFGGFQTKMKYQIEDFVMWAQVAKRGAIYFTASPTANYRVHPQSYSNRQSPLHAIENHIEFVFTVGDQEGQSYTLSRAVYRITERTLKFRGVPVLKRIGFSLLILLKCIRRGWLAAAKSSLIASYNQLIDM